VRTKVAAFIFALAGVAYLTWDISLAVSSGVRIGSWLVALVSGALLYQSYSLFRARPRARLYGMISAAALAASFWGIVALIAPPPSTPLSVVPVELWSTLAAVASVAFAFSIAFAFLWADRRAP